MVSDAQTEGPDVKTSRTIYFFAALIFAHLAF
jgi:hypothetical protein